MKIILPILVLLLCSACDEANSFSLKSKSKQGAYTEEELLGKTVDEYEAFIKSQEAATPPKKKVKQKKEPEIINGFLQLSWDDLVSPGYDGEAILAKYEPLVETLEEGSDEAFALYEKMEAEFNNAPANESLANKKITIPGFIAPLEQVDGLITEFLLVPYFGACIHSPPPPANQTLHVKVAPSFEIKAEDAYDPIWVSGALLIEKSETEIGNASYIINDATISKYDYE